MDAVRRRRAISSARVRHRNALGLIPSCSLKSRCNWDSDNEIACARARIVQGRAVSRRSIVAAAAISALGRLCALSKWVKSERPARDATAPMTSAKRAIVANSAVVSPCISTSAESVGRRECIASDPMRIAPSCKWFPGPRRSRCASTAVAGIQWSCWVRKVVSIYRVIVFTCPTGLPAHHVSSGIATTSPSLTSR